MTTESEFTIDALARAAHTTVRSVRVYHERGLLPAPQVRGRIGYYRPEHLVRLQTIGQLLRKGMKLTGIKELLDAWDRGEGLDEVLQVRSNALGDGTPHRRSTDDDTRLANALQRLRTTGGTEPDVSALRATHPRLHELAARLIAAGLPADEIFRPLIRLHADCSRIAARQAEIIRRLTDHPAAPSSDAGTAGPEQAAEHARQLAVAATAELVARSLHERLEGQSPSHRATFEHKH
ncbi:MerR family transcriptional regulator [Nocardia sp. CC227C]|uniref:MerR family transcriptional regulator n=1 Tax=Nocardia sp. CC227C TaxID=3044562 RepID=UPI00278BD651|nr:MerR family transcriptional regulator [Nocardia sp. CC227C]